jgi:prepilin-type N-terminal cleavage/methylation domain-containing protein
MNRLTKRSRSAGFTLIELMIAMTILSFIALGVYQTTAQTFSIRDSLEQDGDFYNSVRVALDVIGRDIAHIYTPNPFALPGKIGQPPAQTPNTQPGGFGAARSNTLIPQPPTKFWAEPLNEFGFRASRITGEANKLSFISNGHMRLFRDSAECDFVKVYYWLDVEKPIQGASGLPPRGKVLMKRENNKPFDELEREEEESKYPLLTGIKSLEFKYLDGEKDQWLSSWDNTALVNKGVFPSVIKVIIEVFTPNSKAAGTENTLHVEQLFRPEGLQ